MKSAGKREQGTGIKKVTDACAIGDCERTPAPGLRYCRECLDQIRDLDEWAAEHEQKRLDRAARGKLRWAHRREVLERLGGRLFGWMVWWARWWGRQ